jgi:hypothetical protein
MDLNKASDSLGGKFCTIKICMNENYSRVRVDKSVSDMCPSKHGLKTRRCFITIAFKLFHYECSGKAEWLEIKWHT